MPKDVLPEQLQNYVAKFTSPENVLLANINRDTQANHPQAHMLSGHVQGRALAFISKLVSPRYILEIGTFTGYSALCLAEGLAEKGGIAYHRYPATRGRYCFKKF